MSARKMTVLQKSVVARNFYEALKSSNIVSGWEKFVLTDGENCLFVDNAHQPILGETVFACQIRKGVVHIQLHRDFRSED